MCCVYRALCSQSFLKGESMFSISCRMLARFYSTVLFASPFFLLSWPASSRFSTFPVQRWSSELFCDRSHCPCYTIFCALLLQDSEGDEEEELYGRRFGSSKRAGREGE
jgi:hypothetical protein